MKVAAAITQIRTSMRPAAAQGIGAYRPKGQKLLRNLRLTNGKAASENHSNTQVEIGLRKLYAEAASKVFSSVLPGPAWPGPWIYSSSAAFAYNFPSLHLREVSHSVLVIITNWLPSDVWMICRIPFHTTLIPAVNKARINWADARAAWLASKHGPSEIAAALYFGPSARHMHRFLAWRSEFSPLQGADDRALGPQGTPPLYL